MKALVLETYMNLVYQEVPEPPVLENEVLIKVKAVGICGSDVHGMDGSTGRRIPPIIMGHEASGVVEKIGAHVKGWNPGDRVTFDSTIYPLHDWYTERGMYNLSDGRMVLGVSTSEFKRNGAFAERVVVPEHILYKVPENVSFTEAALVEPAAVALHAINLSPLKPDDAIVVIGAGMVGMFVIQLLKIKGYTNIIAIDLEQQKLDLAKRVGADHVFLGGDEKLLSKCLPLLYQRGADVVFEVVGTSQSIKTGIELTRKGGTLTVIGNLSPTVELPLQTVVTRQLRIQGSCAINGEYPDILELIAQGKLDVKSILSAEAPLSEGTQWFERLYNKEKALMKVILKP